MKIELEYNRYYFRNESEVYKNSKGDPIQGKIILPSDLNLKEDFEIEVTVVPGDEMHLEGFEDQHVKDIHALLIHVEGGTGEISKRLRGSKLKIIWSWNRGLNKANLDSFEQDLFFGSLAK